MLRLQATSFSNQPTLQPLGAEFDELGGNIGRSAGNTLILPDEKRYISRTQASVTYRNGSYYLQDQGSATPTVVNGNPVGNGNEVALHEGDELRIGEYVLVAHVDGSALAEGGANISDPFADLIPQSRGAPEMPPSHATPAPAARASSDPFHDPFGSPPATAPAAASGVIPHDYDPFADLLSQASSPPSPQSHAPNLIPASGDNVDDLFGLSQPNTWDPLGSADPIGGQNVLSADAGEIDHFADLAPQPARSQKHPQRDDAPMLSGAFQPLRPQAQPPASVAPARASAAVEPARANPNDMVVSWDTARSPAVSSEIKTVILPSPKRAAPASAQPTAQPAPPQAAPSAPVSQPVQSAGVRQDGVPGSPQEADALLKAFLEGAGIGEMRIASGLTPELMAIVGELLRESIRGTLDLLLARALTKREVRAQATVIVAKENNPLKFSPTVEAAFGHLLTPQGQGFMPPASAVRDAYNDLRSHQFGFMAGMRAALEGVLMRFDPAQLEGRLTRKSVLGTLVPGMRRAKLWELYEQLYREISREAQDDFQTLFGKEFLRAYEAQIDKLEQEDAANKR